MNEAESPIFVIGTGRSGTTLLRKMLCAHPRIYITHEASFYVWESLYGKRAPRRELLEFYFQTYSFRWLGIDVEKVLAGLPDPLPHDRIGLAFAAVMRTKAASYGRPRFGDKTPSHAAHLARIFEDFPGARVVHIVRDPRDTALSLSQMPWACRSLHANAAVCEIERRQVHKFRDRMLQIRLEDLLREPRETMSRVLDHVGEPWDDAVLDHAKHAPERDMPPLPWLEGAARERSAPKAKWGDMRPVDIRIIERITKRIMDESGYEPAKLEKEPSALSRFWARLWDSPEILRCMFVYLLLAKRMRDPSTFDTKEVKDLFRRVNPRSWARYPGFELPNAPRLPPRTTSRADEPAEKSSEKSAEGAT